MDDGVHTLKLTAKEGATANKLTFGNETIWEDKKKSCTSATIYLKRGGPHVVLVQYKDGKNEKTASLHHDGTKWKDKKDEYDKKLKALKESVKAETAQVDRKSNIKADLFNVQESDTSGIICLTCTPKDGKTPNTLVYGSETIWDGGSKASCTSALIYFDGAEPHLVTLTFKNDDDKNGKKDGGKKEQTLFLCYDGKKWKDDKDEHGKKLKALREAGKSKAQAQQLLTPGDGLEYTGEDETPAVTEPQGQQPVSPPTPVETSEVQDSTTSPSGDPSSENTPQNGRDGQYNVSQDGVQPANPAAKDVKMDVSKIDGTMFTIQESTDGKVPTKTLTPKDGHRLTEVSDGPNIIWKSSEGEHANRVLLYYDGESPILATVTYTKPDGKASSRLYIKQGDNTWEWVDKPKYDAKLAELKGEEAATPVTPPTVHSNVLIKQSDEASGKTDVLDIKNSSAQACRAFSININGIPTHVFVMHPDVSVTEVKNGDKTAWKKQYQEYCYYCIVFLKGSDPDIMLTMIESGGKSPIKTYTKSSSKSAWESIADKDVSTKVDALKPNGNAANTKNVKTTNGQENAGNATTLTKFSLDLSTDKDTDKCNVVTFERNGLTSRFYVPKDGHSIEKAMDGDKAIFQLNDKYTCFLLEYYSKGNTKLLRVHAENVYTVWLCGYEKNGQEWKSIEEKVFNEKFKGLVPATTSQPSQSTTAPTPKN